MATPTYDLIDSQVLSTSAASVSFSSIPATYRDLVLVIEVIASGDAAPNLRFNSDTASNYFYVIANGDGSSTSSVSGNGNAIFTTNTIVSGNKGMAVAQIMDYSATDKQKSVLVRANSQNNASVRMSAQRWANSSAITSVDILASANNFAAGSTFYLYGIAS